MLSKGPLVLGQLQHGIVLNWGAGGQDLTQILGEFGGGPISQVLPHSPWKIAVNNSPVFVTFTESTTLLCIAEFELKISFVFSSLCFVLYKHLTKGFSTPGR